MGRSLMQALALAVMDMRRRRNECLTLEHILLAMTHEHMGRVILEGLGVDLGELRHELDEHISRYLPALEEDAVLEVIQSPAVERALERARSTPGFSQRVLIPAYALAAASFCLLFGGAAATFGVTFAIGVIVQAVQPWFAHIQMGVLLGNFVGGWLTAVLAQMLQIALPVYNVNAAIIGGIMPLLSGLAMTTAVRDTVYGDLVSGMTRALEAMLLATAVAIGVYTGLKMAAMMGGIAL